MKAKPTEEYKIEFAKIRDDDGNEKDFKFNFVLTFKRPLPQLQGGIEGVQKWLMVEVGGIDGLKTLGNYTVEVYIARTFDPDEVIRIIEETIAPLQSDLMIPKDKELTV
jgi:hypothetical protein